ncbi:MAG: 50S ribosomal protein L24 [Candidatus Omnitrophica bacterium]|nr:50S ribosomal protein L24 [Candidatus Omnitrophota bacterium]
MSAIRLRKSDQVVAVGGRDAGKKGKVLKILPNRYRAIVEGICMVTEHQRPTRDNPKGGVIRREGTVHLSNLMLVCPRCAKPTRISHTILADGSKKRTCKRCKEII